MAAKDIVSKDILKRIAVDIARVLLKLEVDQAEIIETDYQRVEDRHADLAALMSGEARGSSCISRSRTTTIARCPGACCATAAISVWPEGNMTFANISSTSARRR